MEDDKNGAESKPLCLPRGPGPQGVPYAWLHKDVLWKIREGFDMTTYLDQALAVYLVHCELASDAQSPRYAATRRKIAERAGVSVRRVTDIHTRFQLLGLLKWEQQFIEGTKELGENIYTLMMSGTACTRSGTERKSENCTVNKQSSEKSPEESPEKGKRPLQKLEDWKLRKDLVDVKKQLDAEKEKTKPDPDILNAFRGQLRNIKDELRERGKAFARISAEADDTIRGFRGADRNAGTYNANQDIAALARKVR